MKESLSLELHYELWFEVQSALESRLKLLRDKSRVGISDRQLEIRDDHLTRTTETLLRVSKLLEGHQVNIAI